MPGLTDSLFDQWSIWTVVTFKGSQTLRYDGTRSGSHGGPAASLSNTSGARVGGEDVRGVEGGFADVSDERPGLPVAEE